MNSKKFSLVRFFFLSFAMILLTFSSVRTMAKPFKRVLVISGGGLNPGTALGIIDGVVAKGWIPDLIISTCGSSLGPVFYNSNPNIDQNIKDMHSPSVMKGYQSVEIENSWAWDLKSIFDQASDFTLYPAIFNNTVLKLTKKFDSSYLQNVNFRSGPNDTKIIMVGSKALFKPEMAGKLRAKAPLFKVVYFTDTSTANLLKGRKTPVVDAYPYTNVSSEIETITHFTTIDAFRATLADPYALNPYIVDGEAYFTGAIDLYPITLAKELGDEVVATYPFGLYSYYENLTIRSAFGFSQSIRSLQAIQNDNVQWIDLSGQEEVSFNPEIAFVSLDYRVPSTYPEFKNGIDKQWELGKFRAQEALAAPKYSLAHLREPISKTLLKDFSCKNANAWSTPDNEYCVKDSSPGCDRSEESSCTPLR